VDKLTVISTDGAGQLPRTVADNVAQGMELLSATTGVDLGQLLQGFTRRGTTKTAAPSTAPGAADGKIEITE
jgi:flotillin